MIEKLTEEQKARFPEFVEKWTKIGLSTEPANRQEAEDGIKEAYEIAGLDEPKIVWCSSPLAQGLTRSIVLNLKNEWAGDLGDSIRDSVENSVMGSVGTSIRCYVRAHVWAYVKSSVWNSIWNSIRGSVWNSIEDSIWTFAGDSILASVSNSVVASVRDSVEVSAEDSVKALVWSSSEDSAKNSIEDSVKISVWNSIGASAKKSILESVKASVWDSAYGQYDANWLSLYDYFKEVCGLEHQVKKLSGIFKISKNAGWWLPHEKICWVSERPCLIKQDSRWNLHNYDGPALTYPDGWSIYAFHGVHVPEKYALTSSDEINIDEVLKEPSSEVRMAVLGKTGLSKALGKIDHQLIDSKNNNDLIEFNIENEPVRGLVVRWTDKFSDKTTVLPVPRTIEEFKESFCDEEFPEDFPDDVNDCEQVRLSTFRGLIHMAKQESKQTGKNWMDCIEWGAET